MRNKFANVLLPIPKEIDFDYIIPEQFSNLVKRGVRVLVPFGKKEEIGFVYEIKKNSTKANSYIKKLIDEEPLINENLFKLACWMSDRFLISKGEALNKILPENLRGKPRKKKEKNLTIETPQI
ncbi:MAG: hypothetical protein DRI36_05530, partial [Caldiserica bacterium]